MAGLAAPRSRRVRRVQEPVGGANGAGRRHQPRTKSGEEWAGRPHANFGNDLFNNMFCHETCTFGGGLALEISLGLTINPQTSSRAGLIRRAIRVAAPCVLPPRQCWLLWWCDKPMAAVTAKKHPLCYLWVFLRFLSSHDTILWGVRFTDHILLTHFLGFAELAATCLNRKPQSELGDRARPENQSTKLKLSRPVDSSRLVSQRRHPDIWPTGLCAAACNCT